MNITKFWPAALLWLHVASTIVACVFIGFAFATTTTTMQGPAATLVANLRTAAAIVGGLGVVTGFGVMASRSGPNESLAVAVSTVLALVVLLFALGPVQVLHGIAGA